jgi:hypothetical protein
MRRLIRYTLLAVALSSLVVLASTANTKSTLELPPVSDNAALQYWQAFAMLPALDAKQEKLLETWADAPLDDAAGKLLDQSRASLMFLHRGAKLQWCDWGIDYRDGISMFLPHLAKARVLGRLAALDARRAFETHQGDRAREDAFGMVALAHHVGSDHTLVSTLVCYAIEGMAIDAVTPYLPGVSASYKDAVSAFQSLPPSPRLDEAMLCEKRLAGSIIKQLQDAEKHRRGSWRDVWQSMLGKDNPDPLKDIEDLGQLVEVMDKFMHVYDELSQLMALPAKEFDAKYPAFVERTEAAQPIAKLLLPSVQKIVTAQRRSEARMAMLLAAIAVVEGGPEKLAGINDPFGDGPFGYRKLEPGFELSSKLQENGKPVKLVIGQKKTASTR